MPRETFRLGTRLGTTLDANTTEARRMHVTTPTSTMVTATPAEDFAQSLLTPAEMTSAITSVETVVPASSDSQTPLLSMKGAPSVIRGRTMRCKSIIEGLKYRIISNDRIHQPQAQLQIFRHSLQRNPLRIVRLIRYRQILQRLRRLAPLPIGQP